MKTLTFASAAAIGALLAMTPALATSDTQARPATSPATSIEQTDKSALPATIRENLEELRRQTAEQKDAAVEAARKMMDDMQASAERAREKMKQLGEDAERKWAETSAAFQKQMEEAEVRLNELQVAAAEKWNEARAAAADALEKAANTLDKKS